MNIFGGEESNLTSTINFCRFSDDSVGYEIERDEEDPNFLFSLQLLEAVDSEWVKIIYDGKGPKFIIVEDNVFEVIAEHHYYDAIIAQEVFYNEGFARRHGID